MTKINILQTQQQIYNTYFILPWWQQHKHTNSREKKNRTTHNITSTANNETAMRWRWKIW